MDIFDDEPTRSSGTSLPLLLQKKIDPPERREKQRTAPNNKEASSNASTSEDLENYLMRASVAMVEIQKQLYRGEEVYYEETNSHGNIYRGWDAFIDLKDVGLGNGGSSSLPNSGGSGGRRMPSDQRWFSGSCKSVLRNSRPVAPFGSMHAGRAASAPTLPSVPRSASQTPVPRMASPIGLVDKSRPDIIDQGKGKTNEQGRNKSAGQDKNKPEKNQLDKNKPEKNKSDKSQLDKIKPDKNQVEKTQSERTKPEKTKSEKHQPEKTKAEQSQPEKTQSEKAPLEKVKIDKSLIEKTQTKNKTDKGLLEMTKPEKMQTEKTRLERCQSEKIRPERMQLEKAKLERSQSEKIKLERSPLEKTKPTDQENKRKLMEVDKRRSVEPRKSMEQEKRKSVEPRKSAEQERRRSIDQEKRRSIELEKRKSGDLDRRKSTEHKKSKAIKMESKDQIRQAKNILDNLTIPKKKKNPMADSPMKQEKVPLEGLSPKGYGGTERRGIGDLPSPESSSNDANRRISRKRKSTEGS